MNDHAFSALERVADQSPYPLVFATLSGAHLYGFASPDSDFDLRGCHVLKATEHLGLKAPRDETREQLGDEEGLDLDLVTHDVGKFCAMLLSRNGYVLEQLTSPIVVQSSDTHQAMLDLVPKLVTRHHAHHYLGFARNQWQKLGSTPTVKALLYTYRVLLTGIHLMRSGEIEANLGNLINEYPTPDVARWIDHKQRGGEFDPLSPEIIDEHREQYEALLMRLEHEREVSKLPDTPAGADALDALVVRTRLATLGADAGAGDGQCHH